MQPFLEAIYSIASCPFCAYDLPKISKP